MTEARDDKAARSDWDGAWSEGQNCFAERAGLVRVSAFGAHRRFPLWDDLPDDWHEPLSKYLRERRERIAAEEAAERVELEARERVELARLLKKYESGMAARSSEAELIDDPTKGEGDV